MATAIAPQERAVADPYADLAAFFDRFADEEPRWKRRNSTYHRLIRRLTRFVVPPGARVLEIGSGSGDLLAGLEPSSGVGVDVSRRMVERAREAHPDLRFEHASGEELDLGETFDYVVLSDLMPYVHDLLALFHRVAEHSHPGTRVVISSYSRAWRPIVRLAELLRLKPRKPLRNWVSPHDVANLLELAGLEPVTTEERILFPKQIPLLTTFLNGFVGSIWPFNHLCLTYWIVARPHPRRLDLRRGLDRLPLPQRAGPRRPARSSACPDFGVPTELIFVEGNSTDDTRGEILRQIDAHPERDIRFVPQPGKGKGDAVRAGFEVAKHDVLMILDGDLSVSPEDLPKFHRGLVEGRAELVNGSRLVYDMEPGSMRFLNMLGNKAFARLLKWIMGQLVKDTLCGTKALLRRDYERIAAGRAYFGDFDPFGDFDLLFGAARLNLRIVDLPVRYHPRTYGETNISRWRHGTLLLRMTTFAFWKFKVAPYRRRSG